MPDSLVSAYARAWNAHDVEALGELFAPGADWVMATGKRRTGREAIQAAIAAEHASWARVSTMRVTSSTVRALRDDVAVVAFDWELSLPSSPGEPWRGNTLLVASREGDGWRIASGQVAVAPSPR